VATLSFRDIFFSKLLARHTALFPPKFKKQASWYDPVFRHLFPSTYPLWPRHLCIISLSNAEKITSIPPVRLCSPYWMDQVLEYTFRDLRSQRWWRQKLQTFSRRTTHTLGHSDTSNSPRLSII
jgi:hypothetical protein